MGVDFDQLAASFNQWAKNYVELSSSEWCGIDGKSLKGTVCDYNSEDQNFVSVVSVFAGKRGLVLGMDKLDNKQASEITTVQNLITALDIKDAVFSLDALHCPKKLVSSAANLAQGIRGHWGIENRLHWVKDMVFDEDNSTIRKGNAPANCSVLMAVALNVLRRRGYSSITCAQRFLAHDIDKIFSLVE